MINSSHTYLLPWCLSQWLQCLLKSLGFNQRSCQLWHGSCWCWHTPYHWCCKLIRVPGSLPTPLQKTPLVFPTSPSSAASPSFCSFVYYLILLVFLLRHCLTLLESFNTHLVSTCCLERIHIAANMDVTGHCPRIPALAGPHQGIGWPPVSSV